MRKKSCLRTDRKNRKKERQMQCSTLSQFSVNKTLASHDSRLVSHADQLDLHLDHLESIDANVADIRYVYSILYSRRGCTYIL